ncbi:MAG: right-handed parallel beta-helix repeat-containing protein, partial [Candidatus Promineofilum sp.]|nr:right-handed parallel beta-helix repeat-containing protein [Promineifilum sp.]
MAERHVGSGKEYTTLATAAAAVKPGDVVIIHDGTYLEALRPPRGTTWQGAEGEARPIIDGGWAGGKTLPGEASATQVLVDEADVTLRGLEIRNVRGKGVAVAAGGDNFLMEDCEIHHTAAGGFGANGTGTLIHGVTLRGCYLHHLSLTGKWQETPVNGCCLFRYVVGVRITNTRIRFGYGEGFALGPFTEDAEVDGLRVEDTAHLGAYVSNRARRVHFANCIIVQRGLDEWQQGDGDVGGGFVVGDEVGGDKTANWPHGDDIVIENCIAINTTGIGVRNRKKVLNGRDDGYDTRPERLVVQNCTFIAGPNSSSGVSVLENQHGGHVRGTFRNNLFVFDRLPIGAKALANTAAGVTFVDNVWTAGVPAGLPASNRAASVMALVAPFATPGEELDID